MSSLILWLLAHNIPLGHFRSYSFKTVTKKSTDWKGNERSYEEDVLVDRNGLPVTRCGSINFGSGAKEIREQARKIVNGLSQYDVAQQVAKEWGQFPPRLRMDITDLANTGWRSGNVSKGIAYLDQLLGGKIRVQRDLAPTERKLGVRGDELYSEQRRINPAAAAAQGFYSMFVRPPNYHQLSKREQKQIDREIAEARREFKRTKNHI